MSYWLKQIPQLCIVPFKKWQLNVGSGFCHTILSVFESVQDCNRIISLGIYFRWINLNYILYFYKSKKCTNALIKGNKPRIKYKVDRHRNTYNWENLNPQQHPAWDQVFRKSELPLLHVRQSSCISRKSNKVSQLR